MLPIYRIEARDRRYVSRCRLQTVKLSGTRSHPCTAGRRGRGLPIGVAQGKLEAAVLAKLVSCITEATAADSNECSCVGKV